MQLDFAVLSVRCFKDGGSDIYGIPILADQRAYVASEVVEVEDVGPSCCGPVHEMTGEITELDVIVEDGDED